MSTTATWQVPAPTSGQEYIAPAQFWIIPQSGSTVQCIAQSFDGAGNLLAIATLEAVIHNVSQNVDHVFVGNNSYAVTAASSVGTNGSNVFAPAFIATFSSQPAYINVYLSYTGALYDQPPNAPSNLNPVNGATVTTQTPVFSGSFSDPTAGDYLAYFQVQVYTNSGTLVWDSGQIGASNGSNFSITSGVSLSFGSNYYFIARMRNQNGNWGAWSANTAFFVVQGPNAPANLLPADQQTTLTPAWSYDYSSPASVNQQQYHWWITASPSGQIVYDNGWVTFNVASGIHVASTIAGSVNLQYGQSYVFNMAVKDINGAISGTASSAFQIAPLPIANPISPANNASVSSQTPTFQFSFSDGGGYAQQSYQIQAYTKTGGTVWDSGQIASTATSVALGQIANPSSAPSVSASGSGSTLLAGTYKAAYTYKNIWGETQSSAQATITITAGQNIVFGVLTLPPNVTAVEYYLSTVAGGSTLGQVGTNANGAAFTATAVGNATQPPASNSTNKIPYANFVQWRVQVWDTAGLASGWTNYASFYVNNSPTVAITSPGAGSVITNNTPTITFTYTPSSGGFLQASAQILLLDMAGNTLATYAISGAGTSYTLPAGVLINGTSYQLEALATDTASEIGQSASITFTLQYTPPADMQGQSLVSAKNYIVSPYLNQLGSSGRALNWSSFQNGNLTAYTYQRYVDANFVTPFSQANGNGVVLGAQALAVTGYTGSPGSVNMTLFQDISVATAGWVAGTTVLSFAIYLLVQKLAGNPNANVHITFKNGGGGTISFVSSANVTDTAGQTIRLVGPQNVTIPVGTVTVQIELRLNCNGTTDLGYSWWCGAQLEVGSANDANYIAGDLGTGYSYDTNGYSVRAAIAGGTPTLQANPGTDSDPTGASGNTLVLNWDNTLADSRFTGYLIERRRQDQAGNDSAWQTLATLTNSALNSYTDFTPGHTVVYQYAIRQTIQYADGSGGISAHRAIVIGGVVGNPAWYLTNTQASIYNLRFKTVDPDIDYTWQDRALYRAFIGRKGTARDAGPSAGYEIEFTAYWDDAWGDLRPQIRKLLITMHALNVVWNYRDPSGMVLPVHIQEIKMNESMDWADGLLTVKFKLLQAADTLDY